MSTNTALARASLAGSMELLTICGGGALLSSRHILDKQACTAWSKAIFNLFLPALLFSSITQTIHQARTETTEFDVSTLELFVPSVWALVTLLISGLVATIICYGLLRKEEEAVRRVIFVALLLGNANNLPILLINSLCENFQALSEDESCSVRGTGHVALFVASWNCIMWTVVLSYLMNAPDTKSNEQHDERPLLSHTLSKASMTSTDLPPDTITLQKSLSIRTQSSQRGFGREPARRMRVSRREMLLSPPFLAIVFAAAFANIPELPEAFLSQDGPLSPFKQAIDLLGRVVVPASSLIVGARLHAYYTTTLNAAKPSAFLLSSIVVTRFLFLPFIGRLLYQILDVPAFVSDPLLRIYMLIPYFMPTASNSVVMVQMVAAGVPNIAERMEGVLLACIFWQYATAPLFLTANMALGLMLVFREE